MAGLKQVAQGFGLWANEHEARFPMEVPVLAGGSRDHALTGQLLPNLLVAAKYLGDPRLLICPSDNQRQPATNFAALTTTNISFFLNVGAAYTNQSQIIVGDRDVTTNGSSVRPGPLEIREPLAVGWGKVLHSGGGNIALVDGSGHQINTHQFRARLATGITNRLVIP